jgi:hypothetical protein
MPMNAPASMTPAAIARAGARALVISVRILGRSGG